MKTSILYCSINYKLQQRHRKSQQESQRTCSKSRLCNASKPFSLLPSPPSSLYGRFIKLYSSRNWQTLARREKSPSLASHSLSLSFKTWLPVQYSNPKRLQNSLKCVTRVWLASPSPSAPLPRRSPNRCNGPIRWIRQDKASPGCV